MKQKFGTTMKYSQSAIILVAALALTGCAKNPKTLTVDYVNDAKFNTAECKEIRKKALEYNDRVLGRTATGVGLGLLLGPFGIPLAAMGDVAQNEERKSWNREIHLACSSEPLPESFK